MLGCFFVHVISIEKGIFVILYGNMNECIIE